MQQPAPILSAKGNGSGVRHAGKRFAAPPPFAGYDRLQSFSDATVFHGDDSQSGSRPAEQLPALALNADFRPLSYFPLSLWSWQDTVKAVFLGRVTIISEYDSYIRSPSMKMRLPSVIALKDFVPQSRHPAFTRFNVFLRDRFTCQYCQRGFAAQELTFDHVIPRSRGGRTNWTNVVAACGKCNLAKANKLPEQCGMVPRIRPAQPTTWQLQENGRRFPPNYLHHSWRDYLYWDTELEAETAS